jgi:hypothetical protein
MSYVASRIMGALILCAAVPTFGATISWTTWMSQPTSTTVNGTLTVGSTPVSVTYTGEVAFTQLNGTGTDYFLPVTTFTAPPTVSNAPPSDMIAIDGTATVHTIQFGTTVVNPIIDIVSLGRPSIGTQYIFTLGAGQSMSILNQGPSAGFGGCNTCLSLSGTTLTGTEGDGVIQFIGNFDSLSWTGANPEFWNGFTVGATDIHPNVPEPATWGMMLLAAIAGIPAALRRRRSQA